MTTVAKVIPGGQGVLVPEDVRAAVSALAQALGERGAMRGLGVGRLTLARMVAGFPVRAGTLALVRESLAAMKGTDTANPKP